MNILIVCPRLCHGGAERVAVCLANGFVERGHTVRFMTNLFEEQTYKLDSRVIVVNLVSTTDSKIKKWFSAYKLVHKEVKKSRPDIVIGIMELCSFISKIATLGSGVPIVATEHNSFERPQSAPMSLFERFFKFTVNIIFDHVTVLTEADKNVIGKRLKSVVVMPNPLAIEPTYSVGIKKNTILAAGRVDNWHYKGFDILIKAWSRVVSSFKFQVSSEGWRLQIAGVWRSDETIHYLTGLLPDGEWTESDGSLKSDIYQVEFLGFVDNMKHLYQQSSIFVLSSRYEAFGLVLIEAMSQGCACVACDYKGRQREIICPKRANDSFKFQDPSSNMSSAKNQDSSNAVSSSKNQDSKELECGAIDTCNLKPETHLQPETTPLHGVEVCENGILCEPDNVEALASALEKMIDDDAYRESVRSHAIERSKYYDMEHTMDRWEAYLDNIIKEQQK